MGSYAAVTWNRQVAHRDEWRKLFSCSELNEADKDDKDDDDDDTQIW